MASDNLANPSDQLTRQGTKSERGFASMDPERQRAIASQGGKAAHQSGNAHRFTSEEGRVAGRKGGQASGGNRARLNRQNAEGASAGSTERVESNASTSPTPT